MADPTVEIFMAKDGRLYIVRSKACDYETQSNDGEMARWRQGGKGMNTKIRVHCTIVSLFFKELIMSPLDASTSMSTTNEKQELQEDAAVGSEEEEEDSKSCVSVEMTHTITDNNNNEDPESSPLEEYEERFKEIDSELDAIRTSIIKGDDATSNGKDENDDENDDDAKEEGYEEKEDSNEEKDNPVVAVKKDEEENNVEETKRMVDDSNRTNVSSDHHSSSSNEEEESTSLDDAGSSSSANEEEASMMIRREEEKNRKAEEELRQEEEALQKEQEALQQILEESSGCSSSSETKNNIPSSSLQATEIAAVKKKSIQNAMAILTSESYDDDHHHLVDDKELSLKDKHRKLKEQVQNQQAIIQALKNGLKYYDGIHQKEALSQKIEALEASLLGTHPPPPTTPILPNHPTPTLKPTRKGVIRRRASQKKTTQLSPKSNNNNPGGGESAQMHAAWIRLNDLPSLSQEDFVQVFKDFVGKFQSSSDDGVGVDDAPSSKSKSSLASLQEAVATREALNDLSSSCFSQEAFLKVLQDCEQGKTRGSFQLTSPEKGFLQMEKKHKNQDDLLREAVQNKKGGGGGGIFGFGLF